MTRIEQFAREEFLSRRFHLTPGDHVTFLGPTQSGKTTLAFQMLDRVISGRHPAVAMVMKPRDPVPARWGKAIGLRRVAHWPPLTSWWPWAKPRGWLLWPRHSFEPDDDDARMYAEFRRAILGNYKQGNRITFGDEVWGLAVQLGLTRELETVWSRGASMGNGLWTASQRPRNVPLMAYSQAEHVLMSHTPDKQDRDRYAEIGGVDPDMVRAITARLPKYHWLYVRRTGPRMCIVEP